MAGATGADLMRSSALLLANLEGEHHQLLPAPEVLLTPTPKVPGLDGRKMSKSYGNTIGLTEDPESIARKIKGMQTDPARVRRTDPGTPEKCPVWDLHKLYSTDETRAWVRQGCTTAGIGCIECKKPVIEKIMADAIAHARARRSRMCSTRSASARFLPTAQRAPMRWPKKPCRWCARP